MRNLAIILPLKSKLSGKFLRFNTIDVSKYWKVVEFRRASIKMKNCKIFYETQTASHLKEVIQPPTPLVAPKQNFATSLRQNFSEGDV